MPEKLLPELPQLVDGLEAYTVLHQVDAEISACTIVRDQKTELLDWIAHHQKLGARPLVWQAILTKALD